MAKYKIRETGETVNLDNSNFVAQGGEGAVHIIGDTVFKVCLPGRMIHQKKFEELAALDHNRIVRPQHVLLDGHKRAVGYTMPKVPERPIPLAQMLSKAYREREGVTPDRAADLVKQMAAVYRFVHSKPQYLIVDGNEFNWMVTRHHTELFSIDVNSYQTPSFQADAIMPSIRDWQCPSGPAGLPIWNCLTDWYSFAVLSFYLFTGIHPFKGRHPAFMDPKTAMIEQMKAGKSVLDPQVQFPKAAVYHPFESVIPGGKSGAYFRWYGAVFTENRRLAPPVDFQEIIQVATVVRQIVGSNNFTLVEIGRFSGKILGFWEQDGREIVLTTSHVYSDGQQKVRPSGKLAFGFRPGSEPLLLTLDGGTATLHSLESPTDLRFAMPADDIFGCGGRIYVRHQRNVWEIIFPGGQAAGQAVASVMPYASQVFPGVIVQDILGARTASVFPETGHHRHVRLPELTDLRVTDARYESNVLMVVGLRPDEGGYDRFVYRFGEDFSAYDLRKVENITPSGLNFTVLDTGVCVCIAEDESVEVFARDRRNAMLKVVSDPAITGDMLLFHAGSKARLACGETLYEFSLRK